MGLALLKSHQRTEVTDEINVLTNQRSINQKVDILKLMSLIDNETGSEYEFVLSQEEAARCLRKKLKYGRLNQQILALDVLNQMIMLQYPLKYLFNDEKLTDRLLVIALNRNIDGNGKPYDALLIKRCQNYIVSWHNCLKTSTSQQDKTCYLGLNKLYCHYREANSRIPKIDKNRSFREGKQRDKKRTDVTTRRFSIEALQGTSSATNTNGCRNDHDKKYRIPAINLDREIPTIKIVISDSMTAATALRNSLIVLPKGSSAMNDTSASECFVKARNIRRKVLRYLQLINGGELLGPLILANDELVNALMEFDNNCRDRMLDCSNSSDENYDSDDFDEGYISNKEDFEVSHSIDQSDPFDDENVI